jgi:hypothetical protein
VTVKATRIAAAALTAALAFGAAAPAADAAQIFKPDGTPAAAKWQGWADESGLWIPPGIVLTNARCPFYPAGHTAGCQSGNRIWVSKAPRPASRFILLHELGHAVDDYNTGFGFETYTLAATTDRRRELAASIGWARWKPETFADRFALCGTPNKARTFIKSLVRKTRAFCRKLRHEPARWVNPAPPDAPMIIEPPADPGIGYSDPAPDPPAPEPEPEPAP